MLFFTALKNLKKNFITSLFECLQMTAVIMILLVMISSVLVRYKLYTPFQDYFQSNGIFAYYTVAANEHPQTPTYSTIIDDKDILNKLNGATDIISCHSIFMLLANHPEDSVNVISYDDEIINRFKPELSEGRWINLNSSEPETVISENDYNYHVGDYIDIDFINESGVKSKVKVVGKLKNGTKIPGYRLDINKNKFDFNDFYYPYYYDIEKMPILLFSYSQIDKLSGKNTSEKILQPIQGAALIKYKSSLSSAKFESEKEKLSSFGDSLYCNMNDLNKNSISYLYNQVYNLLPIIVCLALLVFITNICNNALSTRRRLKDYTIYYINGLQWKQCVFINLIQSCMIFISSSILSLISILVISSTQLKENITIISSGYSILFVIILMILYILISMIMPFIIIKNNTPKQILTR